MVFLNIPAIINRRTYVWLWSSINDINGTVQALSEIYLDHIAIHIGHLE